MIKKNKSSVPLSACTVIVFSNQELYARPLIFSKNVSLSNLCSSILNQRTILLTVVRAPALFTVLHQVLSPATSSGHTDCSKHFLSFVFLSLGYGSSLLALAAHFQL